MSQSNYDWVKPMKKVLTKALEVDQHLSKETTSVAGYVSKGMIFAQTQRKFYTAEVANKDSDYIYHFYPQGQDFKSDFEDKMGDAFITVFKNQDKLAAAFVPEMNSWAVKVSGYANNPLAGSLVAKVFDELDKLLEIPSVG